MFLMKPNKIEQVIFKYRQNWLFVHSIKRSDSDAYYYENEKVSGDLLITASRLLPGTSALILTVYRHRY